VCLPWLANQFAGLLCLASSARPSCARSRKHSCAPLVPSGCTRRPSPLNLFFVSVPCIVSLTFVWLVEWSQRVVLHASRGIARGCSRQQPCISTSNSALVNRAWLTDDYKVHLRAAPEDGLSGRYPNHPWLVKMLSGRVILCCRHSQSR
jgi:hypothetical protein